MKRELRALLYRSFDDALTADEQKRLSDALAASPELRAERNRITETRSLVNSNAIRSFRPFFAARVLNRIASEKAKKADFLASLKWSFRLVGAVGAVTVILLFTNNALKSDTLNLAELLAIPQLTLEETLTLEILPEED